MKPKQRKQQKQTSRLYLRRKDHRDIIMNDTYHNMIWLKKTKDDGTTQDELVWAKYPKNALVGTCGVENQGTISWMDIDRQFQYGLIQGNNMSQAFQLDNGVVVYVAQTGAFKYRAYATLDGIVWKDLHIDDSVFGSAQPYHFGGNALVCKINAYPTVPLKFNALVVEVDEDGEITSHVRNYTTSLNSRDWYYLCNTQDGMLFYVYTQNSFREFNGVIYHLSTNGNTEQRWIGITDLPLVGNSNNSYCNNGSKSIFLSSTGWQDYSGASSYTIQLICGETDDDGRTWNFTELKKQSGINNYRLIKNDCCVRDGEFFIFYGWDYQGSEVKCLASYTGTSWNEIALPSWVDLPISKDGTCVNSNVGDTLRIAIRPSETSNYDIKLFDLIGSQVDTTCLNRQNGNILFKDGKPTEPTDEDIYFCFGYAQGWRAYFDNKYLTASSKAFAWNIIKQSASGYKAETIQENDYCVRNLSTEESEE